MDVFCSVVMATVLLRLYNHRLCSDKFYGEIYLVYSFTRLQQGDCGVFLFFLMFSQSIQTLFVQHISNKSNASDLGGTSENNGLRH